jgi:kynureninase
VVAALDEQVAAVVLTEVDFRTGRRHDMTEITAAAHRVGALAVWDLAHSAGVLPVDVSGAGADFAVGCGYKYLHGGPGAPGFLYVSPRHVEGFENPLRGWFGHADPFAFSPDFEPARGIERGMVGTPNVLSLAALDEALDVFSDLDIADLHEKSIELTGLFIDLVDEVLGEFEVVTPRDPDTRGSHVSLRHDAAYEIVQALISRGVVGDFRTPDVARFGFSPLTVRYADVYDAVMTLRQVMDDEAWREERFERRRRVT